LLPRPRPNQPSLASRTVLAHRACLA
jgi:hypothetical protein